MNGLQFLTGAGAGVDTLAGGQDPEAARQFSDTGTFARLMGRTETAAAAEKRPASEGTTGTADEAGDSRYPAGARALPDSENGDTHAFVHPGDAGKVLPGSGQPLPPKAAPQLLAPAATAPFLPASDPAHLPGDAETLAPDPNDSVTLADAVALPAPLAPTLPGPRKDDALLAPSSGVVQPDASLHGKHGTALVQRGAESPPSGALAVSLPAPLRTGVSPDSEALVKTMAIDDFPGSVRPGALPGERTGDGSHATIAPGPSRIPTLTRRVVGAPAPGAGAVTTPAPATEGMSTSIPLAQGQAALTTAPGAMPASADVGARADAPVSVRSTIAGAAAGGATAEPELTSKPVPEKAAPSGGTPVAVAAQRAADAASALAAALNLRAAMSRANRQPGVAPDAAPVTTGQVPDAARRDAAPLRPSLVRAISTAGAGPRFMADAAPSESARAVTPEGAIRQPETLSALTGAQPGAERAVLPSAPQGQAADAARFIAPSATVVPQTDPGAVADGASRDAVAWRLHTPVGSERWGDALGERVVMMLRGEHQVARLTLNPEHLGPLELRLRVNDDQAQLWVHAQNPQVREALESALPRLREMMAQQGLDLSRDHGGGERQAQPQPGPGSGDGRRGDDGFARSSEGRAGSPGNVPGDNPDTTIRRGGHDGLIDHYA